MRRMTERGEGRLGGLIALVLLLAFGMAAWNLVPVYYEHYDLTDKVTEICRTPRYKATDEELMKMLMDEARRRDLDPWIVPSNFEISTSERGRRIKLHYEREVAILPGWKKNFVFDYIADQPLI